MQSQKESKRTQMEMRNFILHKNLLIIMEILQDVLRHILKKQRQEQLLKLIYH